MIYENKPMRALLVIRSFAKSLRELIKRKLGGGFGRPGG